MWLGGMNSTICCVSPGAGIMIWRSDSSFSSPERGPVSAVGVKRLHDRDKSGWWILLFWLGTHPRRLANGDA